MKIPLWLISGYLGSGKTTLLLHILSTVKKKIAILMNEFGDIGIDTKTIQKENMMVKELLDGCVCCSLTGEFNAAINEIIKEYSPELIVVETTGVAEPDALITDIKEDLDQVQLDLVITVVDADTMVRFPRISEIGHVQIETADLLLLNKIDLVKKEQIKEVKKTIKQINSRAVVVETDHSNVNPSILFGTESISPELTKIHTQKHEKIEFFSIEPKPFNRKKLESFLKKLKGIFRLKGYVAIENKIYLLNYVAERWNLEKTNGTQTKLVFIGESISSKKDEILSDLENCFV